MHHQLHIDTFDDARLKQSAVSAKVKEYAENIYSEMKADAMHFYRNLENDTKRGKAESWGILYREVGEDGTVYSYLSGYTSYDGEPVPEAELFIEKDNLTIRSNQHGYFSTHQVSIGFTGVLAKSPPYKDKNIPHFEIKPDIENKLNIDFEMDEE